jgi:hypothetical protein
MSSLSLKNHWLFIAILACTATLNAQQRKYIFGTSVSVTGGSTNAFSSFIRPEPSGQKPYFPFYGLYPAVTVTSEGTDALSFTYAFGWNQTRATTNLTSDSHRADVAYKRGFGSNWKTSFSDAVEVTSDAQTFNALRGAMPSDEDFRFLFYPVAVSRVSRVNSANALADYTISDKSSVSFGGLYAVRAYSSNPAQDQQLNAALSNQQRVSGSAIYRRRSSDHDEWSFGYTNAFGFFENFETTRSDTVYVGYSTQLGASRSVQITTGTSHVKSQGTSPAYFGYDTSVRFQQRFQADSFSIYYAQDSGQPTGLGSVSDVRRTGFSWQRDARKFTASADASLFDARGSLGNTLNTRGSSAVGTIGIPLTRTLSLQAGAQYQRYGGTSQFAFSQERFFFILRYSDPNLWILSR